jgi:hypothetical protein
LSRPYIEEYLLVPPTAGQGVHQWIYGAAHKTYKFLEAAEQIALLNWAIHKCGRAPSPPNEIEATVRKVRNQRDRGDCSSLPAWPKPEPERTDQLVMTGPTLAEFHELSAIQALSDDPVYWLNILFSDDPLLCIARELVSHGTGRSPEIKRYWATRIKSQWTQQDLCRYGLIVPNVAVSTSGHNQERKPSRRCSEMFPARTYLGIELDYSTLSRDGSKETVWAPWIRKWERAGRSVQDACAAVLWHLNSFGPLILAYWSGGKSIHSLFRAHDATETVLRRHMTHAVKLGADPVTWSTCQLIRLPAGTRTANGNRQLVCYFNPENL